MQCVNCGFENIPGQQQCVRCQSTLALERVGVAPPRASRLRAGSLVRRFLNGTANAFSDLLKALTPRPRRGPTDPGVRWEAVAASLLPGLGHLWYDRRPLGAVLLGVWLALMGGALLTFGMDNAQWFLAGAVGIHAFAITWFLGPLLVDANLLTRMFFGMLLFAGLRLGLYYPVGWLTDRLYTPMPLVGLDEGHLIRDGDVILHEGPWLRSATYHRGDLVVYNFRGKAEEVQNMHAYIRFGEGFGVDRIVGVAGDRVEVVQGALLVNGRPIPRDQLPLGSMEGLEGLEVKSAEGYVILPTRLPLEMHGIQQPLKILTIISNVPAGNVVGRVVFRIQPLARIGRLQ